MTKKSVNSPIRFIAELILSGCSTAIRFCFRTAGDRKTVLSQIAGVITAKTRFCICWRSVRRRIRFRRRRGLRGNERGKNTAAIVIWRRFRRLFIHQFSHAFVDFRGRREHRPPYVDYFENSVKATRAQQKFFAEVLSKDFPKYSETMWGLTASDSERGYIAWGAPPREPAIDGTVVPCAPAGSLMFAPDITLPALKAMKNRIRRHGFIKNTVLLTHLIRTRNGRTRT